MFLVVVCYCGFRSERTSVTYPLRFYLIYKKVRFKGILMTLKKKVVDDLTISIKILEKEIEASKIVLQQKNIEASGENVLNAGEIIATNLLAITDDDSNKPKK